MTCHEVQLNLSLYLYGELDFVQEESVEQHLNECALCQRFLAREKEWHGSVNSVRREVPLDLLAECRQELGAAIARSDKERKANRLRRWLEPFSVSSGRWSARLALASFLVFVGFAAARWMDRHGFPIDNPAGTISPMGLLNPSYARVRDIRAGDHNQVHILFDQVNERAVTGTPADENVRRLLLAAMQDTADPGIRVDSVEVLKDQNGSDVRDALLHSVRHDSNAAVRLKALEALRPFSSEKVTRDALKFVLQHDSNADVRSEAIDILAPVNRGAGMSADLAATLEEIARSEQENDYVRERCLQLLRNVNAPLDIY
jgi:Putative zinc-finger/HEAT repeats